MANSTDYSTAHDRAVALLARYQDAAISIAERELAYCLANGDTDGALRSDQVRRAVAFMLDH